MQKSRLTKTILLICTFLVIVLSATKSYGFGAIITWDGEGGDNNWSTPANWDGDIVPSENDDVVFNNTSSKPCTINISTTVASFSIQTGSTIIITATENLTVTGDFSLSTGTFNAGSTALTVEGDWTLAQDSTFNCETSTVTFTNASSTSTLTGSTTFYGLVSTASGKLVEFSSNTVTYVTGHLNLEDVILRSTLDGGTWYLTLSGTQDVSGVDVQDSNASGGNKILAPNSTDSGNNTNWLFDSSILTWDGSESTDWNTAGNWDWNMVPLATQSVIIPNVTTNDPQLNSSVSISSITIESGGQLSLNNYDITISSDIYIYGSLICSNTEQITLGGSWYTDSASTFTVASSTVTFNSNNTDETIKTNGKNFDNLVFDSDNGTGKWTLQDSIYVTNEMVVSTGTLDVGGGYGISVSTLNIDGGSITGTNCDIYIDATNINHTSGSIMTVTSGWIVLLDLSGSGTYTLSTITSAGNVNIGVSGFIAPPGTVTLNGVVSAGERVSILSNGNITVNNTITSIIDLNLSADDCDGNNSGDIYWGGSGSATMANSGALQYKQASSFNYSDVTAKITGGTTGGLYLYSTNGSVTIDTPTTGRSGGLCVTICADNNVKINANLGTSDMMELCADYDGDGTGSFVQSSGTTLTCNGTSVLSIYGSGSGNYLANITGYQLALYQQSGATVFTLRDNSAVSLSYAGTYYGLYIGANTTLDAGTTGTSITIGGAWSNYGTFNGQNGLVTLNGSGANKDIRMAAGSFNDLTINGSGSWREVTNITVNDDLTVTQGTFNCNAYDIAGKNISVNGGTLNANNANTDIDLSGNLSVTSGSLSAPPVSDDTSFTIAGNWNLSGTGSFTPNNGRIVFDTSSSTTTLSGSTTFYGLVSTASGKLVEFSSNTVTYVTGHLNLEDVILRSTLDGATWYLNLSGTQDVSGVDVQDSNASGGNTIVAFSSTNSGSNTNWDFGPPDAITNLSALTGSVQGTIDLTWSAPGDDGGTGDITDGKYGIKYATYTSYDFNGPSGFDLEWSTNTSPGASEAKVVTGLTGGVTYYFRIWTADDVLNWSGISNGATTWAQETTPPDAITNLSALTGSVQGTIDLTWSAPGDDGGTGDITDGKYGIKYATYTTFDFNGPSSFDLEWSTSTSPGNNESKVITGLTGGVTYYFRIWTADDVLNWSGLSNGATAQAAGGTSMESSMNYLLRYDGDDTGGSSPQLGYRVAFGDFDGDGKEDLAMGAYRADFSEANSGSVYIKFGDDKTDLGTGDKPLNISQNYDIRYDGPTTGGSQEFGYSVAFGDFDGDGKEDLAMSARYADFNGETNSGSVYIVYGSARRPSGNLGLESGNYDIRYDGPTTGTSQYLGWSIAFGDLDGDGKEDLAMAALYADFSETDAGSVYIVYGNASRPSGALGLESGNYDIRYDGPTTGDSQWLGYSVAFGDLDGDGKEDLAMGACCADFSETDSGSVYIVYGNASRPSGNKGLESGNYDIRYDGPTTGDSQYLGYSVSFGDFDGDGKDDLAMAAYAADFSEDSSGSVYIVYGNASRPSGVKGLESGNYDIRYDGPTTGTSQLLGTSVAFGDFDGDGKDDLAMGAYQADFSETDSGSVYIVYGNATRPSGNKGLELGNYDIRYDGPTTGTSQWLGQSVAFGDFFGNGKDELAMGAYGTDFEGTDTGSVYIVEGIDNRYFYRWDGGGEDNNWSTADNWVGNIVPGVNDDVIFDATSNKPCTIDISTTVASFSVQTGSTITITVAQDKNLTVSGDFILSTGTFNSGSSMLTIGGDFEVTGDAIFNCQTSTVTFNTNATSTLIGSTTFYGLKMITNGKTLRLTEGTTTYITNHLNFENITLRSTLNGATWYLNLTGTQDVSGVDVRDSNASGGDTIIDFDCPDIEGCYYGNNTNWDFGPPDAITNLSALTGSVQGTIDLTWSAPGDDGGTGDITDGKYGIKYATYTSFDFNGPSGFDLEWSTSTSPGNNESKVITGLTGGVTYYFRIWTRDDVLNWSGLSNGATAMAKIVVGANRYWVGETDPDNWNDPNNWSATSGGTGNAGVPGTNDTAIFDGGNTYSCQIDISSTVASVIIYSTYTATIFIDSGKSLTASGSFEIVGGTFTTNGELLEVGSYNQTGGIFNAGGSTVTCNGDFSVTVGTFNAGASILVLDGTDGNATFTGDGYTFNNVIFQSTGTVARTWTLGVGTITFNGNFQLKAQGSGDLTVTAVTNNPDLDIGGSVDYTGTGTGTELLSMGEGTWTVGGNVDFSDGTVDASTSTFVLNGTSTQTLTMDGNSLNILQIINSSSDGVYFADNLTLSTFTATTGNTQLYFCSGSTFTFTNIELDGQSESSRIVLRSTSTNTAWYLTVTGNQSVSYVDVEDSDASGGNTILAIDGTSQNSGNNVKWDFGPPAAITDLTGLCDSNTSNVTLYWSTPGDDGWNNTLVEGSKYRIDYSSYSIQWSTTTYDVEISTSGVAPYTQVSHKITGLTGDTTWYFQIWTRDEIPTNWSGLSNGATVWVNPIISVSISTDTYDFGEVPLGNSTHTVSIITVTNDGNIKETYSLKISSVTLYDDNPSLWKSTHTTTAHNRFIFYAIFHGVQVSTSNFDSDDYVIDENRTSTADWFSDNDGDGDKQTGINVPKGDDRKLWFRLDMPTSTTTGKKEKIIVTITAGPE